MRKYAQSMDTGPDPAHDRNVIAAAAVLISDRIRYAVEEATGAGGESAHATTALLAWADGMHIDALAAGLRVSHSRAVRIVDSLERGGLATRRADPADARRALVVLTAAGRRSARLALRARDVAVGELCGNLGDSERQQAARIAEKILEAQATNQTEARSICRMCDISACGHERGECPSTAGADAR